MQDESVAFETETETAQIPVAVTPISFRLSNAIVVKSEPQGGAAESIHALRTHLASRHVKAGRRGLVVCETDQAGGAFIAANLAMSLADAGYRTLLVDADFRRPQLPSFVTSSEPVTTLAEVIDNPSLPIGSAIQQVSLNFSIAYAGDADTRAQEMLASQRLVQFFDLCMRDFDLTIAISPPANFYSDARRLAALLRYVVVTVRRDLTYVDDIKALINELTGDGARVIGTVYNDF